MTKLYNFDVTISTGIWNIQIDNDAQHGYFEHNKTGAGGELWFEVQDGEQALIDYDGVAELPEQVECALTGYGYKISESFAG